MSSIIRLARISAAAGVVAAFVGVACAASTGISRERAVAIARSHASFPIRKVLTERAVSDGHRVWRVTLQGEFHPGTPLFESVIVEVDRETGEVVSIAKT